MWWPKPNHSGGYSRPRHVRPAPQHTSWTMLLLQRLDDAVGSPGVLGRPIFPLTPVDDPSRVDLSAHNIQALAAGNYDDLFHGAPDKPSDLYKSAQVRSTQPGVRLLHSDPVEPLQFIGPKYPAIARLANVSGQVTATLTIGSAGDATNVVFKSGSPPLRGATEEAVRNWKFPPSAAGQSVEAVIDFNTNCKRE
jgi:TonB family protein